jgi:hypothetical protein
MQVKNWEWVFSRLSLFKTTLLTQPNSSPTNVIVSSGKLPRPNPALSKVGKPVRGPAWREKWVGPVLQLQLGLDTKQWHQVTIQVLLLQVPIQVLLLQVPIQVLLRKVSLQALLQDRQDNMEDGGLGHSHPTLLIVYHWDSMFRNIIPYSRVLKCFEKCFVIVLTSRFDGICLGHPRLEYRRDGFHFRSCIDRVRRPLQKQAQIDR